jgi:hypothetical protein
VCIHPRTPTSLLVRGASSPAKQQPTSLVSCNLPRLVSAPKTSALLAHASRGAVHHQAPARPRACVRGAPDMTTRLRRSGRILAWRMTFQRLGITACLDVCSSSPSPPPHMTRARFAHESRPDCAGARTQRCRAPAAADTSSEEVHPHSPTHIHTCT